MGSCAAPSAKGDDKFITTDYLQQCPTQHTDAPMAVSELATSEPFPVSCIPIPIS
ncbi:hypothetical protein QOK75_22975 [Citrobacter freundii]|uniref:hypothetical protein n=1 Tax=Citrobacter freundii TaxID=546 RepID=UPI0025427B00|nr:hypothetical protein [Citrobacter freundii]WIJ19948.1 hypothetical protein QOK75_22975 [Citrobacter freundii]